MLIIKNGALVTEQGVCYADLAVENGKIAAMAACITPETVDDVLDATGLIVFPGFIDGHTHFDMHNGICLTADDFQTGTRAALRGGTTTVVDFATQDRGDTLANALSAWHKKADGRSSCNYAFHMAITDWNERTKAEIADMFKAGITSFKLYFAYDLLRVSDAATYEVLCLMRQLGGLVGVHCENGDLVTQGVLHQKSLGHFTPDAHPLSRPPVVEAEAVHRLLAIARLADCAVHIVHLSTKEGLEEVRRARALGQKVFVETCPQYLLLTDECYNAPAFEGAKYVCSPPIRSAADRAALRGALTAGEIDTISTDHCSYTLVQKAIGKDDFSKIPNGLPGVEHRPEAIYTAFVATGKLSAADMARLLSTNVARQFGMYPQKGTLMVGSDADLALWDASAVGQIKASEQLQNTDYTPFEGMNLMGKPKHVLLNGEIAVRDGQVIKEGLGRYVPRKPVEV